MRHRRATHAVAFCVLVLALTAGCTRSQARADERAVVIVMSGDVRGEYAPCGCKNNPAGGLAKRSQFIGQLRGQTPDLLVVDLGNQFHEHPQYGPADQPVETAREDLFVDVMNHIKATAAVPGVLEFALGPEAFRKESARMQYPYLAGNMIDEKTGQPIGPTTIVVNAGGYRVGMFGVVSQDMSYRGTKIDHTGYKVTDPADFAKDAVKELKDKSDFVVAIVNITKDELEKFGRKADGVAVIMAGNNTGLFTRDVQQVSGIPVLQVSPRGREVGVLRLVPRNGKFNFVNRSERDAVRRRLEYFQSERDKIVQQAGGQPVDAAFADSPATVSRYNTFVAKIDENQKELDRMEGDKPYFEFSTQPLDKKVEPDMQVQGWLTRFADTFHLRFSETDSD